MSKTPAPPPYYPPQPQPPPPPAAYHPQHGAYYTAPPPPPAGYYPPPPVAAAPPAAGYYPPPPAPPAAGYYPAPAALQTQGPGVRRQWSSGLCDCFDDVENCFVTCFCPCVTFGQIAEIVDRGSTSCGASGAVYALICAFSCCQWLYSCSYRSKLRFQYNLPEEPCADCCVHCCCSYCAICQEYRELQNRGFHMKLGWQGNIQRQASLERRTAPPQVPGGMVR